MAHEIKLTGYFAGALFSGQELFGNRILAGEIDRVSRGIVQMDVPQDLSTQETGDGRGIRSADYLGMLRRDFVFANMNGPELDSGTVAEYVVASMLGMPRVQYRSDFRNVGDVPTRFAGPVTVCLTKDVPYNLMLGHDESALVFANSMALYKSTGSLEAFLHELAVAAVRGIQLCYQMKSARPGEYAGQKTALVRDLKLDAGVVTGILKAKQKRHGSREFLQAVKKLKGLKIEAS